MKIHLVVKNVDLGYHAIVGFIDEAKANTRCEHLNANEADGGPYCFGNRYEVDTIQIEDM